MKTAVTATVVALAPLSCDRGNDVTIDSRPQTRADAVSKERVAAPAESLNPSEPDLSGPGKSLGHPSPEAADPASEREPELEDRPDVEDADEDVHNVD